jgi:hypothetical protein
MLKNLKTPTVVPVQPIARADPEKAFTILERAIDGILREAVLYSESRERIKSRLGMQSRE